MRAKTVIINANIACNIETGNTNKRNEKFIIFLIDFALSPETQIYLVALLR